MRNFVVGCIVLFATAGTAFSETKEPPKELAVDLGNGVKLEMVLIPAGEFMMGSPDSDKDASSDEKPQHRVRITKPFYLGKYLVTQEQWEAVMGNNPSHFKGPKNPVEKVSWDDCQQFLEQAQREGGPEAGSSQLPTEAQWEYACRAGSTTKYLLWGRREPSWANMRGMTRTRATRRILLARRSRTPGGCTTCTGTCGSGAQDWYGEGYYAVSPVDDPTGPATGSARVIRGGCLHVLAGYCRSAARYSLPGYGYYPLGLRASLVPAESVAEARSPESVGAETKFGQCRRWPSYPSPPQPPENIRKPGPSTSGGRADHQPIGMKLTLVPSGEFMMGSGESAEATAAFFNKTYGEDLLKADFFEDEHPQHRVRITKPFYLGTYHVTRGQFRQFVADTGYKTDAEKGEKPGA